jgi:hypothetical protein
MITVRIFLAYVGDNFNRIKFYVYSEIKKFEAD